MPKKLIVVFIALIFLGIFVFWPKETKRPESSSPIPTIPPQQTVPVANSQQAAPSAVLTDSAIEPRQKVRLIDELDLTIGPEQKVRELLIFINSPNPHGAQGENIDPHSSTFYEHQKEAALRVFALRKLSEALSYEDFRIVVQTIEQDADDLAIIRIAQQALEAKKNQQNYFENLKQGIRDLPLPD